MKTKNYLLALLAIIGLTAFTLVVLEHYEVTKDFSI